MRPGMQPSEFCTSAALPTLARGDAESIVSETWLLATVELAVASCGTEPPDGPAGLLSPHPLRIDPTRGNRGRLAGMNAKLSTCLHGPRGRATRVP